MLGAEGNNRVEVVSGLTENDRVVIGNRSQFRVGEHVQPKPIQQAAAQIGDSAVDKAGSEQRAWRQKDQENINQVYEQQKKLQQQQLDAMAMLRKAQAELNAINSQKVSETMALTREAKEVGTLQSGNLPPQ